MKTYVPMPRYDDSIAAWETYFQQETDPVVELLRIRLERCIDKHGKPLPEYQPVYDLIYRHIVKSGYKLHFNRRRHSFELNWNKNTPAEARY